MAKIQTYAGVILLGVASTLIALKVYEYFNKPKVAAPATAAAADAA